MTLRATALILISLLPLAATAESETAKALREAAQALAAGSAERGAFGRAILANERAMAELRAERRRLALARAEAITAQDAARQRLDPALRLLLAMRRAPLPGMLTHPAGPEGATIAASMAATLAEDAQRIITETRRLEAEIQQLAEEAVVLERSLTDGLEALATAQEALRDSPAPGEAGRAPDGVAAALLLANSGSIAILSDKLGEMGLGDAPTSACTPPLSLPDGARPGVASGVVAAGARDGLTVSLPSGRIITAPCAGVVRFAAPFPGLQEVIILEPADGLLFILGGFGTVFVEPGAVIGPDTPLGALAGGRDGAGPGALYIEIRRAGAAQDASRWFTTDDDETEKEFP